MTLISLKPPPPPSPPHRSPPSSSSLSTTTTLSFPSKPISHFTLKPPIKCHSTPNPNPSPSPSFIDMIRTKSGLYTPKSPKVVILWDLDNKPPRRPPYDAAISLKTAASHLGDVVEVSAFANRHAFIHVPDWVLESRRERLRLDRLEQKRVIGPTEPYVCGVCGRKLGTNSELKRHFKQLHERERQKKLNRMYQLKGKKREKYRERYINKNDKYEEAATGIVTPKVGYGLEKELRRAGVYVKMVEDKPQAADWAMKRQMVHSMSRGIDWLFLVSDDSDFVAMLRKVRRAEMGTVVVGDWDGALGRDADFWVSWSEVESGRVGEREFRAERRRRRVDGRDDVPVSNGSDLDSVVDELLIARSGFDGVRVSSFSDGEEEEGDYGDEYVGEEFDEEDE